MSSSPYTTIKVSVQDRIATLCLNRPEVSNAFSYETYLEVRDAVERLGADEAVRVIILTGKGKNFSAGGDIQRFRRLIDKKVYIQDQGVTATGKMSIAVRRCPKPVVAMVNGAAAGAGCGLALACDFRIMTEKSRLIMAFSNMALPGDTGGMYYLERLVGTGRTIQMMMLGEPLGGKEAHALGVASVLAAPETLEEETRAFAARLAARPPRALAMQKAAINEFFYPEIDKFIVRESEYMQACSRTSDFEEAVTAFLEKRSPVFQGK